MLSCDKFGVDSDPRLRNERISKFYNESILANKLAAELEELADNQILQGDDFDEMECRLRHAFWCLQDNEKNEAINGEEIVKVLEGMSDVDPHPSSRLLV
ncbi:unnamed protein product [Cuscuta campestris]|uniref:Uncharacterized protein n=1 Tax=Cuscuta campestris TaxID=132261 RepID=A0A484MMR8_9ASTE|nr:unnamed protein product [Cuscuta campestris]